MIWGPVSTAPRNGTLILAWNHLWEQPRLVVWKTNRRIVDAHAKGEDADKKYAESYFGDPVEMDDYNLAYDEGPTHWFFYPDPVTTPSSVVGTVDLSR